METAKEALEKMGHTLVEFEVPEMEQAFTNYMKILLANGYKGIEGSLAGEKALWFYEGPKVLHDHPMLKKPLFKLARSMGFGRQIQVVEECPPLSSAEFITEYFSMIDYREMFTKKWKELNLDAMISPVTATPAPQHRGTEFTFCQMSYCMMYNYLNYPTGIVPVTLVQSNEMVYEGEHKDGTDAQCEKIMQGSAGLPVCVQVAALACEDEKALGVMQQIQDAIKFHKFAL